MQWVRRWLPMASGIAFLIAIAGMFVPFATVEIREPNLDGLSCMFLHGGCHRLDVDEAPRRVVQTYYDLAGPGLVALLALLAIVELLGGWLYGERHWPARTVIAVAGFLAAVIWFANSSPSEARYDSEPPLLLVTCAAVVLIRVCIVGLLRRRQDYDTKRRR